MNEQKFKRLIMPTDDSSNALSGDFGDWCKEHYIMTFILGLVAIDGVYMLARAAMGK